MTQWKRSQLNLAIAGALAFAAATASAGQITLYEGSAFRGQSMATSSQLPDTERSTFRYVASSAVVSEGTWEACTAVNYRGRCAVLTPGNYGSLNRQLDGPVASVREVAYDSGPVRVVINPDPLPIIAQPRSVVTTPAAPAPVGRVVLYEFPNFAGATAVVEANRAPDLDWANFKNPAASLRIESGTWLVCSNIGYTGDCRVLDPGDYPVLSGLLDRGVYSARQVWRPEYGFADRHRARLP